MQMGTAVAIKHVTVHMCSCQLRENPDLLRKHICSVAELAASESHASLIWFTQGVFHSHLKYNVGGAGRPGSTS